MGRVRQDLAEHRIKIRNRQLQKFYSCFTVGPPDACWMWTGGVIKGSGYGRASWISVSVRSKKIYYIGAHQLAWCLHNGVEVDAIPMDPTSPTRRMSVCHSDACVSKLCVNPAHLRLDTNRENFRDFSRIGRRSAVIKKGHETRRALVQKL